MNFIHHHLPRPATGRLEECGRLAQLGNPAGGPAAVARPEPARPGPRARAAAGHTIGVGSRGLGGHVHVGRRPRLQHVGPGLRHRVPIFKL